MIQPEQNATQYQQSLLVTGEDPAKFLQGQLTCDINDCPTYGAYCNIKGKIVSFFYIDKVEQGFELNMPADMIEITLNDLNKYAMFSKAKVEIIPSTLERNDISEVASKIPEVYANTSAKFFAHDLNLQVIDAVSFTKGCYRGQEIVARMQHRGNLKRGLFSFVSSDLDLQPGMQIVAQEDPKNEGTVVRVISVDNKLTGLAVMKSDLGYEHIAVSKLARSL